MLLLLYLCFSTARKYEVDFSPSSIHFTFDLIWAPMAFSMYSWSSYVFRFFLSKFSALFSMSDLMSLSNRLILASSCLIVLPVY